MRPKVDRWLDLLDRAGWTAIQAAAGAVLTFAVTDADFSWATFGTFVGLATAISVCKVIVGQNTGTDSTGSLIGTPVIQPPPTEKK